MERRNNKDILENYRKIISLLPVGVPVVFSAVLPVDENARQYLKGMNQRITGLNIGAYELCRSNRRCYFINVGEGLTGSDGNLRKIFHEGDGLHLNFRGNAIWILELKEKIAKVTQINSQGDVRK